MYSSRASSITALCLLASVFGAVHIDAFVPVATLASNTVNSISQRSAGASFVALQSTPEGGDSNESTESSGSQKQQQRPPSAASATPPAPSIPRQAAQPSQRGMDPLVASVTRMDPSIPTGKMVKVPLFGEITEREANSLLIPLAAFSVLGFLLGFVNIIQNSESIANSIMNVGGDISNKVAQQPNQVYDPTECRGICSSQDSDIDNLRRFMKSFSSTSD